MVKTEDDMAITKIGRNAPCSCGSGKKYKKCCLLDEKVTVSEITPLTIQQLKTAIEHHQAGRLDKAKAIYKKILEEIPDNAEALHYLGLLNYQTGETETAVSLISKAIKIAPTGIRHNHLGAALQAKGLHDLAIESYQAAIELTPDNAEAYSNLGTALQEQGNLAESIKSFQEALSLNPNYASALNNLGNALLVQGDLERAIECYRHSMSLDADNLSTLSNLLLTLSYYPQCTPKQYIDEARLYGDKVLERSIPYEKWLVSLTNKKEKKLKIGFVSGDFRIHPVGYFLEGMLGYLDPLKTELVAYATQSYEDELTHRIKPIFSEWHSLCGLSDEFAAEKIYKNKIDILIDLSGHTSANRLAVFAWKPAPIQVSWLGYFASTGVSEIDYLLTDAVSVPKSNSDYFSEKLWYLPETRVCLTPPDISPESIVPTAAVKNEITFACFQNLSKINDEVIEVWGQIFKSLPTARLVIRNKQMTCSEERKALLERLSLVGIQTALVTIEGPIARDKYLASYLDSDIMLDTFPYPGGTTTCEALWMGVPTLTLSGNTLLSRQGASLLYCAGLQEWVAKDKEDYIAKAVYFATHKELLIKVRDKLKLEVAGMTLFNASRFSKQFEDAMFAMWEKKVGRNNVM